MEPKAQAPSKNEKKIQVEPKTPDLNDFGISSIAMRLINQG